MRQLPVWTIPLIAVLAATSAFFVFRTVARADGTPPIPHPVAGQEKCLVCHSTQGPSPVPANHTAFDEKTCTGCHASVPASAPPAAGTPPTPAPQPTSPTRQDTCLTCHAQSGLSMTSAIGETISVTIDREAFASSIHGDKLLCTDCHNTITSYPHPKREIPSLRQYSIAQYELCKKCHFDNYTKTLDSVHYKVLSGGDLKAPLCTDCHGAHSVTSPSEPRAKLSQTCAQCHSTLYQEYATSVHGEALIEENNFDVPVCTDCHRSHTIEDPRTASFRQESVSLCSSCHGDEKLMQKYGISTQVVKTYLQDFHGATVALASKQSKDIWVKQAVCTDCHGVHNIKAVDSADSPVIKANLVEVCRSCHPGASINFPSAWLSHYEPSPTKAPAVYFVRRFYWVMIPFMVLGLLAHVMSDLWRTLTNR